MARKIKTFKCKFCKKEYPVNLYVDMLTKNKCCKKCYLVGSVIYKGAIGKGLIELMEYKIEKR